MPADMDSCASSPVGSLMSVSSASSPRTPALGGHFQFTSAAIHCDFSDSLDSDMDNNNMIRNISSATMINTVNVKTEPKDIDNTPKKKRYSKSRARNRSPALVQKLKKTRRSKANDRERSRMHSLTDALETLRQVLPNHGEDNKLTKIETLRFALNYIFALNETINLFDKGESIDISESLHSAQMSATMKLPTASQKPSYLCQQQQLHQQHQQQQQQQHPISQNQPHKLSPVAYQQLSQVANQRPQLVQISHPKPQLSTIGQPPLSRVNVHHQQLHQQQQNNNGIILPVTSNMKKKNVTSSSCKLSPNLQQEKTMCYSSGNYAININQQQNIVPISPIRTQCSTPSTVNVNNVHNFSLYSLSTVPSAHRVFNFEHPLSPASCSDKPEGNKFGMM